MTVGLTLPLCINLIPLPMFSPLFGYETAPDSFDINGLTLQKTLMFPFSSCKEIVLRIGNNIYIYVCVYIYIYVCVYIYILEF